MTPNWSAAEESLSKTTSVSDGNETPLPAYNHSLLRTLSVVGDIDGSLEGLWEGSLEGLWDGSLEGLWLGDLVINIVMVVCSLVDEIVDDDCTTS